MKNVRKLVIMTLVIMLVGISTMDGVSSIAVKKQQYLPLTITAPSFAYEYQPIWIRVTSGNNSIANAKVTMTAVNHTYFTDYTNMDGFVCVYIIGIQHTTNMTITASKLGYLTATKMILIINQ